MARSTSLLLLVLFLILSPPVRGENWPCWRGPRGDGTSLDSHVSTRWNGPTGDDVTWSTELPGRGHSSPIVWEDRIFVTTSVEPTKARQLLCLDRRQGQILWQRDVLRAPFEKRHNLNSCASGTPATDGQLVVVTFLEPDFENRNEVTPGNLVVAAYDFDGQLRWTVKPGRFASVHGFCTSPVLFEDQVLVNGDHDGDAYLAALDRRTGAVRWKIDRENKTRSYVTPLIRDIDGRTQLMFSGSKSVVSLDPRTGSRHWIIDGPTEQFVASLVYNERADLLFMTGGFPDHHILAIKPDGLGNVTQTKVVWHATKGTAYVPSPISFGDYFLVVSDSGVANCFEAKTGHLLWQERLGEHHASPVSAEGRVYFLNDRGVMNVVIPGPTYANVAQNKLDERCYASPAISQGRMFLRTFTQLYCLGQKP